MTMARECTGCRHYFDPPTFRVCLFYGRLNADPSRQVDREHFPGRCWEDRRKDDPQEEQP